MKHGASFKIYVRTELLREKKAIRHLNCCHKRSIRSYKTILVRCLSAPESGRFGPQPKDGLFGGLVVESLEESTKTAQKRFQFTGYVGGLDPLETPQCLCL